MLRFLNIGLRVLAALVLGALLLRLGHVTLGGSGGMIAGLGAAFIMISLVAAYGIVLFLLFGWSLIERIGEALGSLYTPGDKQFRIQSEYSIPEARVKQERYSEAIAEFRTVIAAHPGDLYPHTRISEIAATKLNDLALAESELQIALAKATTAETFALVADELADLYRDHFQDYERARTVLGQVRERFPNTREAEQAGERIATLEQMLREPPPVNRPAKIAVRPSRYRLDEDDTERR